MPRRVSLVIPAYNEEKYLSACLESVLRYGAEDLHEIIVINNASTDNTARLAASFPGVRVVDEPQKGLTRARQRGLLEAAGEIIAYIDADTMITPDWTSYIHKSFAEIPDLVCFSGPSVYYDFSFTKRLLTKLYWQFLARPISWFTGYLAIGGNLVAKKSALEKIGGFDTAIVFYGEDTDIAKRLSQVGRVVFHQPFFIYTSARRLHQEGFWKISWRYTVNFFSIVFRRKAFTAKYQDVR